MVEGIHLTGYVLFLRLGDGHLLYYSLYLLNKYFTHTKKIQPLESDRIGLKS